MPIAHIYNGELGFDVRTKLNALIDQVAAIPTGGGTGDVVGPASAIADAVAIYNGTTGKLIKDGGQTIANIIASAVAASGTGDVVGPAGAVNARIATYNGITGKLIQDGGMTIADVIAAGGGGGGTTILSGSGPPADALGSVGDYYVDEDGNQLYGPKSTVPVVSYGPNQIAIPPSTAAPHGGNGNYELANHVKAAVAGRITAVRYYRDPATAQIARTVNIWTTSGTLLSSGSVANDGGGSGWKQITLTTPVAMAINDVVVVSVGNTSDYVQVSATYPIHNGGDVSIIFGAYQSGAGNFPVNLITINYFTDVVFQEEIIGTLWPVAVDGDTVPIGGSVTSGNVGSVLFIDGSTTLAQDGTFFWNNTLKDLHIGGAYYVNTARAIYVVPHATENNWFEGNAGNQTMTGYGNFATGDLALSNLTTGNNNVAMGSNAMLHMQSGTNNFAMGSNALKECVTNQNNTVIGTNALPSLELGGAAGGWFNVAIGYGAFSQLRSGGANIGIGFSVMSNVAAPTTADFNTVIGHSAGSNLGVTGASSIINNILLGANAGKNLLGASSRNTWVGGYYGPSAVVDSSIAISEGAGNDYLFDANVTSANVWTFATRLSLGQPTTLHFYNTMAALGNRGANYERAVLDWKTNSNVWTIGTEAGGTGVVRPIRWAGLSSKATPIGADSLLLLDSASSGDMKTVLISTLPGGGGGMAIGGAITSATAGSVLFAGAAGILAQDNANFFFDDTTNDLKIGGKYYIGSARAAYTVTSGSGDNWFLGGAGNISLTGYRNFGEGDGALANLTSGNSNMAMGALALFYNTTGYDNAAMGALALNSNTTGNSNIAVGGVTLANTTVGSNNCAVGTGALQHLQNGSNNTAIATSAGGIINTSNDSIFIGTYAGIGIGTSYGNVLIGAGAGYSFSGTVNNNTLIGGGAAYQMGINSSNNTVIGQLAGYNLTSTCSNNTLIGLWRGPSSAMSNVIALSDGNAVVKADYGYSNAGWTLAGSPKAGAPANTDLPSGSFSVIDDISANKTWLAFNKAGTIRQTEIGGTPAGGMSIGGAITGGTAGRVLFSGVGGILDDDSTFTWNDTLKDLAIGGAYYVNAARALYVVPHVTENNWFEGNAGNQTVTGFGNFGTGDLALASVTSGVDNVAVGTKALWKATSATQNFAMGSVALSETLSDQYNTAIGYGALWQLGKSGAGGGNNRANVAIGFNALSQAEIAYDNVAIGFAALAAAAPPTAVTENTIIGGNAGSNLGSTGGASLSLNTMIGSHCGYNLTGGTGNAWLGSWHGPAATIYNTIVLSNGYTNGLFVLDCNLTSQFIWSFNMAANTVPACLHIYNKQNPAFTTTNYERAMVGWDINGNNYFRIGSEAGGTGVNRIIIIDAFAKAGAPAAADVLAGSFAVIDDTSAGQTWLVFNKAGTIRKVQLT